MEADSITEREDALEILSPHFLSFLVQRVRLATNALSRAEQATTPRAIEQDLGHGKQAHASS
ncbi:MAG: hypothetical protein ACE5I7_14380 [Candidatus Binatia bacterium]